MIFARHIGTDKNFTTGKVYPAKPEVESSDAVSFGALEMTDDTGERVWVRPKVATVDQQDGKSISVDRYNFEFLEEVYAVVVKPCEDFEIGQVVVVDDVMPFEGEKADGGKWSRLVYSIKGVGYHSAEFLVLLDRTNVFPGLTILDEATGIWEKVKSVDECLWVVVDSQTLRRSPEDFKFAVDKDGDIMVEPLVVCIDPSGQPSLSKGTKYYVLSQEGKKDMKMLYLVNDIGIKTKYSAYRFRA